MCGASTKRTFYLHRNSFSIKLLIHEAYGNFLRTVAIHDTNTAQISEAVLCKFARKVQIETSRRDALLAREIRSGIRGQVRRGQDGDVLKCRARKGCSFDLANDLPASRVSKFSGQERERERGRRRGSSGGTARDGI